MREYLDTKEISKDLGITHRSIQNYCKDGFLPSEKDFNGKYIVDSHDYHEWKLKHFTGIKKGEVSKYKRIDKELSKNQLRDQVDNWLEWCSSGKLGGKPVGPRTLEIYDYYFEMYLKKLGRNIKLPVISVDNFRKVLGVIPKENFSTRRHVYDAVMSIAKFLTATKQLEKEVQEDLKELKPRRFLPAFKTVLNKNQLNELIQKIQEYKGYQNYCKLLNIVLIKFISQTGLRASEVCNLKKEDVDLDSGIIHVWLGKGNKNRKVGINDTLRNLLINFSSQIHNNSQYFFVNKQGNKITPPFLSKRFIKMHKLFGIKITPHGLRRTFVTINANLGKPLNHLRIACGHSSLDTTQGYCMTTESEVIEAMQSW